MDRSQADQTHLRNDLSVLSGLGYPGGTHRTHRKTEIQRTKTTIAGEGTVSPLTSQGSGTSSFFKCIPTTYSPFLFPAPPLRNYSLYLYLLITPQTPCRTVLGRGCVMENLHTPPAGSRFLTATLRLFWGLRF